MRVLLAFVLPLALLAQVPAVHQEAKKKTAKKTASARRGGKARIQKVSAAGAAQSAQQKPETKPAETKPAPAKQEEAASTSPTSEKVLSGYVDIGARWVGWGGDYNTYRSVVNLRQGTRLIGSDVALTPKDSKLLDSLRLQMFNWGGDPYNTARITADKRGKYRYVGNYSNIAYFNNLPSFADPTYDKGIYFDQRSMDTKIRNFDNNLELFPAGRFIPYFGYTRNSSYGWGVTPLVLDYNEYALRNVIDWGMNEVRGGLRVEMKRWHVTLEEGGRFYEDNQSVYSTAPVAGNRTTPYMGQWLILSSGSQRYEARTKGAYTKALLTASPLSWLDLYGSFIRSKPKTDSQFYQTANGKIVDPIDPLVILSGTTDRFYGNATMPHTSGSFGAEARVGSRLRLRESWETDRFHTDGNGTLNATLYLNPTTGMPVVTKDGERLEVTRNKQQAEALFDILKNFTVRGGYRYEWGDSVMKASTYSVTGKPDRGELKRKGWVAGFNARPIQRLSLTGDLEFMDGEKTYYRTGLYDTRRTRFQGRLTLPKELYFNATYAFFDNKNPNAGVNYLSSSQAINGSLQWLPKGGKNLSVIADYQRSFIKSDIDYLYPLGLFPVHSHYQDNAHTGTLLADLRLPIAKNYSGRLTFGGSFVTTDGTRSMHYYQPQGRLHLPVTQRLEFFSEWRYYGMSQAVYTVEGFRAHTFTGGVRLLM
ncbi:MAG: hypothetical protein HY821_08755 [Acidobacteria bacterium]|nr:hypothetical protein [Acidobacteriota bacterium]